MNATIKTLTLLATLAASLFVSQSARASSCDLPVVGETHLLRALSNDSYVQSINLQGWTGPLGPESEI
ncbi:MAG: hypothetical protein KC420_16115, partial [Myxococcales bacterium]|nr:hypothetical protein [Myxococcales bacterium]